ncbi:MAG: hypothetical protein Dbin4_02269, partial [Alphaproteobacteria bacterium]|nr:hypothetical protein [Alphaproteobacteria bacterium]
RMLSFMFFFYFAFERLAERREF